ncbi:hypothetical protein WSK_3583 [Novosphingobium sp. Rr 2-17]|nr:hypothetical protein WSK_3583 [Novosphingobium sp. Rr 2-17]
MERHFTQIHATMRSTYAPERHDPCVGSPVAQLLRTDVSGANSQAVRLYKVGAE